MKQQTLKTAEALIRAGITDPIECTAVLERLAGKTEERRDKMISAKEGASIAGVHRKTILLWAKKGLLTPRRITRRRIRFSRNELLQFLGEGEG